MSPKTMWITMKPEDITNETDTSVPIENANLEKSKKERSVCKATKVESVQVISLIKANSKTDGNIDSEAYPIEVKVAKSIPAAIATDNKKSLSIEEKANKKKTNMNFESKADPVVDVKQATVTDIDKSPSIKTCQGHIEPDQEPVELDLESEADPVEVTDTYNKKPPSIKTCQEHIELHQEPIELDQQPIELDQDYIEPHQESIGTCQDHIETHQEPIELEQFVDSLPGVLESNKMKGSSAESDEKDMETMNTKMETVATTTEETLKKNEARCVDKSAPLEIPAAERLIPIEIPRIIYWEELGVEPLQLKKIKIGPLTETNEWSEKRAVDEQLENSFQQTETQNKVVDLTEFFLKRNEENADKVRNSSILYYMQEPQKL